MRSAAACKDAAAEYLDSTSSYATYVVPLPFLMNIFLRNRPWLFLGMTLLLASKSIGEVLYDNGPPGHPAPPIFPNGFELTHWIEADDFTFATSGRVDSITIYDIEAAGVFEGTMLWRIYSNSANDRPGTILYSGIAAATRKPTGFVRTPYTEYVIDFPIDQSLLPPGTYWLALHNGPLSNNINSRVYWETTGLNGARPSQCDIGPAFVGFWLSNFVGGVPSEVSFQVKGAPVPVVTAITRDGGVPRIDFTTSANYNYRIEYKNNLYDPSWLPLPGADMILGTGDVMQAMDTDPNAPTLAHRFYRVVLL